MFLTLAQSGYDQSPPGDGVFTILFLLIGIAIYFLPTVLAASRQHPNTLPIFVVNLAVGWTLIGYVVALAWALIAIAPPEQPTHG